MSGSLFWTTFFGEAKMVTALRHEQLVANESAHSTSPLTLTLSRKGRGNWSALRVDYVLDPRLRRG